jgi:hypothetical protein
MHESPRTRLIARWFARMVPLLKQLETMTCELMLLAGDRSN